MSLRLRLSLLYSAILALTLIVFGTVLYFVLQQQVYDALYDALEGDMQQVINAGAFPDETYAWDKQRGDGTALIAQKCNPDGTVVDRTAPLRRNNLTLPVTSQMKNKIGTGQPSYDRGIVGGVPFLIYSKPFKDQRNNVVVMVQVARSTAAIERDLGMLRTSLTGGSSVVTLLAFGVGWVLSGTALRPINRLTATARAIGAERNFGRRVDYSGPPDEVGRLATTFNTMLTELQAAYAQVEHALQAQRRFVADASHELRTPLTTIRGNLGLLQRQPPIDEADRDAVLADMVDETDRMGRLVNDLLTLARTDAGRPLRSEPVPLKPLIDEMCRTAHALSTSHAIVCVNDLDVAACGDEDAIKQVVLILLDNALRYTPANSTVTLATGASAQQVTISVRDTGAGIAPDLLPHIFERFRRGDTARSGGGTGLGLSIAKALVDAQGGSITVDSAWGRGSVFTVTLPRA